jgi:hypothetical protein
MISMIVLQFRLPERQQRAFVNFAFIAGSPIIRLIGRMTIPKE